MNILWGDLNVLQYYLDIILSNRLEMLEDVKLNNAGGDIDELINLIYDMITSDRYMRRRRVQEKLDVLNVKQLRNATVVDELWNILRRAYIKFSVFFVYECLYFLQAVKLSLTCEIAFIIVLSRLPRPV